MSLADELKKLDDLRRDGTLTDAEFAKAKAALLAAPPGGGDGGAVAEHLSDQLAEVRYQNELAQIDREWEIERRQYLVTTNYGRQQVPSRAMGIGMAVVGGVFGIFWTIMAVTITGSAPDHGPFQVTKVVFPLFGIVFICAAIGYGIYCVNRAEAYNKAFARYQARRAAVKPEDYR